jgi:formate hydrogenlyase subunit 3/multisubunit Na+/H+ antiporter MnhD subunit
VLRIVAIATAAAVTAAGGGGAGASARRRGNLDHPVGGWAAPLGIEYVLDPLSAFIAVLIG